MENKVIELIRQENRKIEPDIDFMVDEWITGGDKYVVFYFDEEVKRNRYKIESLKRNGKFRDTLKHSNYRGHVNVDGFGILPLFVEGFTYPLYTIDLKYRVVDKDKCKTEYISVYSPISFKLKDKEDRLCFDAVVKTFVDLPMLINDNWLTRTVKKAYKVEIPNIN